jgi:MFS family permease
MNNPLNMVLRTDNDPREFHSRQETALPSGRLRIASRALQYPKFRIYFIGMLVSFIGTWMQSVAQSWLVYRLTGSPFLLGLTGFAGQIPSLLLAPFGGVLADRHNRRLIIIATQTLSMLQAVALAVLTLTNHVTVEMVIGLALLLGIINAFDMPARQSFLVELVGKDDLMNAIALNSSMFNGARIIGPAVAGLIIGWLGEGICFAVNGLSFLAVLAGLVVIKVERSSTHLAGGSALSHLKEGFQYVRRTGAVRSILLMVAIVSLFGTSYSVLMPIFADRIIGGGAPVLGTLLGAAGVGALGGALTLAARSRIEGLERLVATSVASFSIAVIAFSLSHTLVLSTILIVPAGYTIMIQMSGSNTLLQTIVPDRLRGRVMSFFALCLMGISPIGSLLAGALAARVGARIAVVASGGICLVGALVFRRFLPSIARLAVSPETEEPDLALLVDEPSIPPEATPGFP